KHSVYSRKNRSLDLYQKLQFAEQKLFAQFCTLIHFLCSSEPWRTKQAGTLEMAERGGGRECETISSCAFWRRLGPRFLLQQIHTEFLVRPCRACAAVATVHFFLQLLQELGALFCA